MTRPAAIPLADAVAAEYGALDIWVNNAGYGSHARPDLDEAAWQRTQDINLKGTFFGAQAAARHMVAQRSGAIINLSSYAGVKPRPNCADYASAKAAVAHRRNAWRWNGAHGPARERHRTGFIETPMSSWMHADAATHAEYIGRLPARRLGQPAEIADAVLYLAGLPAYVTGRCWSMAACPRPEARV